MADMGGLREVLPEGAKAILRRLREAGHEALLAGGCVRDVLLGRRPHDFDVATSARPEQVMALFARTIPVGAQFGVVMVREAGEEYQVATFREDGTYRDGRHPEAVQFSDAEGDARRRDFTVNGLFYDEAADRILDFVGGQEDLAAGILRAIGDPGQRFAEDKLRLLRAVRFAVTLDFQIETETWAAISPLAATLEGVSPERIREEWNKILLSAGRVRGLDLLEESGLLARIVPEMLALRGCEQPPEFHPEGDVWIHTRLMLSLLPEEAPLGVILAVLFHDLGKPGTLWVDPEGRHRFNGHEKLSAEITEVIMRRLRYSNAEIDEVVEMVRQHMAFKDVQKMRPAKLRRFMARPTFPDELELHRVDCLGSHGLLDNYEFLREARENQADEPLLPPPLLTGHDLIGLGWKPGRIFKEVLEAVQTQQLEGGLTSAEEAIDWVRQNYSTPS
jgi:tRNA nucleotidyltransferase/poly(A) polymerase